MNEMMTEEDKETIRTIVGEVIEEKLMAVVIGMVVGGVLFGLYVLLT